MRSPLLLSLTLTFLASLSHAIDPIPSRQIDIFAWPLLTTKPQTLAQITYTPTNASIKSYTPASIPSNSEIVRIGFHHGPSGEQWSGIATSAENLSAEKSKTLTLHVRPDGELYHVGWKVDAEPVSQGKGRSSVQEGKFNVEVVRIREGPVPALNQPVVVSADGEEAKEPEKSFLQKYWWALALFLVFQVVMGGAKE